MKMKTPSKITYGNFQDPIGLVIRMLRSGRTAAYNALIREFLSLLVRPIDKLLKLKEQKLLLNDQDSKAFPVILVVGPPRSGSTFIYQALASALPVTYLNNFGALFSDAPLVASKVFQNVLAKSSPSLRSYYGNTEKITDPNDGFNISDRRLGNDRYTPQQNIPQDLKEDMNSFFNAWTTTFKKPFINKNNRNTTCASMLASSLENAYVIMIKRDPIFVAQSLLLAREEIQGDRNIGWGLGCNHISTYHQSDSALHHVAEQVAWIYAALDQQAHAIPSDRLITIDYESFCHDPNPTILNIYNRIWKTVPGPSRLPKSLKSFKASQSIRLSKDEFDQLQGLIQHYFAEYDVEATLAA